MKKAESIKILSFFSLLLFMISCDKNDKDIDIVKCKVNGKSWVNNCESNDGLFGCESIDCHYYKVENNYLNFRAGSETSNSGIGFFQDGCILGMIELANGSVGFSNGNISGNCKLLDLLDTNYLNYINLNKIDTINFLIEGSFQFKVFNLCGDTATLTNGYFKMHYKF